MASKAKRSTTTGKRAATRKSTAAAKPARMNKTDLIEPPAQGGTPTVPPKNKVPKFKPGKGG